MCHSQICLLPFLPPTVFTMVRSGGVDYNELQKVWICISHSQNRGSVTLNVGAASSSLVEWVLTGWWEVSLTYQPVLWCWVRTNSSSKINFKILYIVVKFFIFMLYHVIIWYMIEPRNLKVTLYLFNRKMVSSRSL